MKTLITCNTPEETNFIYELLVDPNKGHSSLSGRKKCTDDHTLIPTIMEFDLSEQEIADLRNLPEVKSAIKNFTHVKPILHITNIVHQECNPRQAIPSPATIITEDPLIAPHSLYYSQHSQAIANDDAPLTDQSAPTTLAFADCSNVDIIIVDTGVDASHPDFLDLTSGLSRVVDFDWGVFNELDPETGEEVQIIEDWDSKRDFFLTDTNGHGTGCASLAAGSRCGFAKNAAIYSMKIFGNSTEVTDPYQALKCITAFVIAKSNNEHGLDSSRPTIISNSWGYERLTLLPEELFPGTMDETYDTLLRFTGAAACSETENYFTGKIGSPQMVGIDNYVRAIVSNGGHFVRAAGNDNAYVDNSEQLQLSFHIINFPESSTGLRCVPCHPVTDEKLSGLQEGDPIMLSNFSDGQNPFGLLYIGKQDYLSFNASPNNGWYGDYPIITVGDISPVGNEIDPDQSSWSTAVANEPFLNGSDNRTIIDAEVRYRNQTDKRFAKSYYSNFGPGVDIYATGNATYAARSNQCNEPVLVEISETEKYRYFNGTSAATPIVAGILASYLSEYPYSTPAEAKSWLLSNSSKGNIIKTASEENTRRVMNTFGEYVEFQCPLIDWTTIQSPFWFRGFNTSRENFLLLSRFNGGSNGSYNAVAQAYPLRNAILESEMSQVTVTGSQTELHLVETGLTTPVTHGSIELFV